MHETGNVLGWVEGPHQPSGPLGYPKSGDRIERLDSADDAPGIGNVPRGTSNEDGPGITIGDDVPRGTFTADASREASDRLGAPVEIPEPRAAADAERPGIEDAPAKRIPAPLDATAEINPPLPDDTPPAPKRALDPPPAVNVPRGTSRGVQPLAKPTHTRIIVVANQKGGVGKTTSAVNIAVALAQGGLRVILIDLDPQGNASTAVGVDHRSGVAGSYEVLVQGEELGPLLITSPESPNLQVLSASIDLAAAELELVTIPGRERRLADALNTFTTTNEVDYVIMDCPPSLGLITVNAMVAARELLVPIQCEYYALEGLSQLLRSVDLVKRGLNDALHVSTVLLTMYDARTRLAAQVAEEVCAHFPDQTLETLIPRSVRISEAPGYGQSVITYDQSSVGTSAYRAAAAELAARGVQEGQA